MPRPTLYILCGLPFSGKSVLARRLCARFGYPVVNIDEIKLAHGFPWTEDSPITPADWERIFGESYERTRALLQGGHSVIYDCANLDRSGRDTLRNVAEKAGCASRLIWVDVPADVARERWRRNRQTRQRFDLPEALFESALAAFERPSADEGAVVYALTDDVHAWIDKHLADAGR